MKMIGFDEREELAKTEAEGGWAEGKTECEDDDFEGEWSDMLAEALKLYDRNQCKATEELVLSLLIDGIATDQHVSAITYLDEDEDEETTICFRTFVDNNEPEEDQVSHIAFVTGKPEKEEMLSSILLMKLFAYVHENEEIGGIVINPHTEPFVIPAMLINAVYRACNNAFNDGINGMMDAIRKKTEEFAKEA